MELLDHMTVLFLIVWGNSILVFQSGCTRRHSYQQLTRIPFSPHSHQHLLFLGFKSHSDRCEMISHCVFNLYFPMSSDVEHLFTCLLLICMNSLEKYLFRSSAHFLISFFLCYRVVGDIYTYKLLIRYMICKYFLPFSRLPFHFVDYICSAEAF